MASAPGLQSHRLTLRFPCATDIGIVNKILIIESSFFRLMLGYTVYVECRSEYYTRPVLKRLLTSIYEYPWYDDDYIPPGAVMIDTWISKSLLDYYELLTKLQLDFFTGESVKSVSWSYFFLPFAISTAVSNLCFSIGKEYSNIGKISWYYNIRSIFSYKIERLGLSVLTLAAELFLSIVFILLKLELLTQFPASNESKIILFKKHRNVPNWWSTGHIPRDMLHIWF